MKVAEIYDRIAEVYDSQYLDEASQQENRHIAQLVQEFHPNPRLLDVGCGTGLSLELELATPERFVGLDPSSGMLEVLMKKYPATRPSMIRATFEDAHARHLFKQPFEVMVSLFGSPSYISSSYMEVMISLAPYGVVMHYLPGYWPEYETETPSASASLACAEESVLIRGGLVFEFNNFQVGVY